MTPSAVTVFELPRGLAGSTAAAPSPAIQSMYFAICALPSSGVAGGAGASTALIQPSEDITYNAGYVEANTANSITASALDDDGEPTLDLEAPEAMLGYNIDNLPLDPVTEDPLLTEETVKEFIEREIPRMFRDEDNHIWHRKTLPMAPIRKESVKAEISNIFESWNEIDCRTRLNQIRYDPPYVVAEFTMTIEAVPAPDKIYRATTNDPAAQTGPKKVIYRSQEPLRWRLESRGGVWYFSEMDPNWVLKVKRPER